MTVDPKQKVPNPPGVPTKRVVVVDPVGYGRYGNYMKGDEFDLTEADWNHIGIWFEEVGANPQVSPRRSRVRLADKNTKDGDA